MPEAGTERVKTKRYHQKREQVVDVAVELFSKNGYVGTGVQDIGEAAGLARGALDHDIGSKDALLAEIHDRVMDPLLAESEAILKMEGSFETRLRLLSESLLWQILNRQEHVWVFLHEYRQLEGEYREAFREKRQRFESHIRQVLAEGEEQGQLRVDDLELTTLAFLNLHNYTYQWLAGRKDLEVEQLAGFYCEIFFNGIMSSPHDQADSKAELDAGRAALVALRSE